MMDSAVTLRITPELLVVNRCRGFELSVESPQTWKGEWPVKASAALMLPQVTRAEAHLKVHLQCDLNEESSSLCVQ